MIIYEACIESSAWEIDTSYGITWSNPRTSINKESFRTILGNEKGIAPLKLLRSKLILLDETTELRPKKSGELKRAFRLYTSPMNFLAWYETWYGYFQSYSNTFAEDGYNLKIVKFPKFSKLSTWTQNFDEYRKSLKISPKKMLKT